MCCYARHLLSPELGCIDWLHRTCSIHTLPLECKHPYLPLERSSMRSSWKNTFPSSLTTRRSFLPRGNSSGAHVHPDQPFHPTAHPQLPTFILDSANTTNMSYLLENLPHTYASVSRRDIYDDKELRQCSVARPPQLPTYYPHQDPHLEGAAHHRRCQPSLQLTCYSHIS